MTSVTVTKYLGAKHSGGTQYNGWYKDTKVVCKHTLSDSASISKLSIYVGEYGGAESIPIRGLIYSDNDGAPGNLIAITEEVTKTTSAMELLDLPFTANIQLDPGTYWIGFFHDGPTYRIRSLYKAGSTNQTATATDDYTDGASETFGTPSYTDRVYPFFATYTTTVTMTSPPALVGKVVVSDMTQEDGIRWQEKSFAAQGRIWVFYINQVGGVNKVFYTSSADDGETWDTPVELASGLVEYTGENVQAIHELKSGVDYVHVFTRGWGGGDLWYRRGQLNSDGSITWTANWNNFWNTGTTYNVDFYAALDSNGYPWVTWGYAATIADMVPYITKSSRNDGIWETEAGYPIALTSNVNDRGLTNNFVVALSSGKIYAFYFGAKGTSSLANLTGKIYGKLWNGVSWGSEETCTTSKIVQQYATAYETYSRGVAVDSDDNIHLVFLDEVTSSNYPAFSWSVRYVKRTWGTGWGSETVVEPEILYKNVSPGMALYGDEIRVFWTGEPSPNIIFMKTLDPDGWWSEAIYLVDETTDTIPNANTIGYDGVINPFPKMYENKLGFIYMTGSSSPYTIKFAFEEYEEYFRVYQKTYSKINTTFFDRLKKRFKALSGAPSFDVTLKTLTLGTRDSTTGWYAKDYEDSTIEMIIIPKSAQQQLLSLGYFVALDALGLTTEPVNVGDRIVDAANRYWEIKPVTPVVIGDQLYFWKCDLKEIFVL